MTFTMSTTEEMRMALVDRAIAALAKGLDADERDIRDLVMGVYAPEEEVEGDDRDPADISRLVEPVTAISAWKSNAEMIVDLFRLGYLRPSWTTLDPTWGRGTWWKLVQPESLTRHDKNTLDGVDFRELPHPDNMFDVGVFDPDYVSAGGRKTSTLDVTGSDFNNRYGLHSEENRTPLELRLRNHAGLTEVARVVKPRQRGSDTGKGYIIVKCMPYISSATLQDEPFHFKMHAETLGLKLVDEFHHLGRPRMQPSKNLDGTPRIQRHARRNHSTTLVFQKV